MSINHTCPRRAEDGTDRDDSPFVFAGSNKDQWVVRRPGNGYACCSYCGSVAPEAFMAYLQQGGKLGVTDKNYKAYLSDADTAKFYFQHLSKEQRREFADMMTAREVAYGYPGYFTVLPYFIKQVS